MSRITFRVGGPPPRPTGGTVHRVPRKNRWIDNLATFLFHSLVALAVAANIAAKALSGQYGWHH